MSILLKVPPSTIIILIVAVYLILSHNPHNTQK